MALIKVGFYGTNLYHYMYVRGRFAIMVGTLKTNLYQKNVKIF